MSDIRKIMLLGSGELGKEVVIAAKRFGQYVVAVDSYQNAPAMQVSDEFEIINMLDEEQLSSIVKKHKPDIIIPEVEAIRTSKLLDFEKEGIFVVPTAEAAHLTMNRDAIRNLAAQDLQLQTADFAYAHDINELKEAAKKIGFPCVIKPVMSSSGKGQSIAQSFEELDNSWTIACQGMRGDTKKLIVEEFISFQLEITLLTIKQKSGPTLFLPPIGHLQEGGDYRESWIPADMIQAQLEEAKKMAKKITDRLGGAGIFGVEFFITKNAVYFSELSPRPHDTGMVTMISQNLSEFDLHVRAVLGLPIPEIEYYGPSASSVILANQEGTHPQYTGLSTALEKSGTEVRIFGKPKTRKNRRMGVALARGENIEAARKSANQAAQNIEVLSQN